MTAGLDRTLLAVAGAMHGAPSAYNRQPWRFRACGAGTLRVEWSPDDGAAICIGCALEAAAHVAHVALAESPRAAPWCDVHVEGVREDYQRRTGIARTRVTNRGPFLHTPPPASAIEAVVAAANAHGVAAYPLWDRSSIDEVARVSAAATARIFSSKALLAERLRWLRPTRTGREVPDGLTGDALRLNPALAWALEAARRGGGGAEAVARRAGIPAAMARATRRGIEASGVLVALVAEDRSPAAMLAAGRAMMAAWLAAVRAGLAAQPVTDALEFPDRVAVLRSLFGTGDGGVPFVVLRLGYTARPAPRTGRRPLEQVLATEA